MVPVQRRILLLQRRGRGRPARGRPEGRFYCSAQWQQQEHVGPGPVEGPPRPAPPHGSIRKEGRYQSPPLSAGGINCTLAARLRGRRGLTAPPPATPAAATPQSVSHHTPQLIILHLHMRLGCMLGTARPWPPGQHTRVLLVSQGLKKKNLAPPSPPAPGPRSTRWSPSRTPTPGRSQSSWPSRSPRSVLPGRGGGRTSRPHTPSGRIHTPE